MLRLEQLDDQLSRLAQGGSFAVGEELDEGVFSEQRERTAEGRDQNVRSALRIQRAEKPRENRTVAAQEHKPGERLMLGIGGIEAEKVALSAFFTQPIAPGGLRRSNEKGAAHYGTGRIKPREGCGCLEGASLPRPPFPPSVVPPAVRLPFGRVAPWRRYGGLRLDGAYCPASLMTVAMS